MHFVYENKANQRECGLTHLIFQAATAYNSQLQFDLFPTGNVMFAGRFALNFDNIMVFVRELENKIALSNLWCNCSEQQIFEEVNSKMSQTVNQPPTRLGIIAYRAFLKIFSAKAKEKNAFAQFLSKINECGGFADWKKNFLKDMEHLAMVQECKQMRSLMNPEQNVNWCIVS